MSTDLHVKATPQGREPLTHVDVRLTIDRLRRSWAWLSLLVEPSHTTTSTRAVTDHQAEILEAQGHADRTYREHNLRAGLSALPPAPVPVALAVIDTQLAVTAIVDNVVHMCATATRRPRPHSRSVSAALTWLTDDGPWVVTANGDTWRQPPVLDQLTPLMLTAVDAALAGADRHARHTAGITTDTVTAVRERCPACRRRSLQLNHDDHAIRCISTTCVCSGAGCGCLQRDRVAGRRHAWPNVGHARDLVTGHARDLVTAVRLRRALDDHELTEHGHTRKICSSAYGHGGWPERRT